MQSTLIRIFTISGALFLSMAPVNVAQAIGVDLKMYEAKKALAAGRAPMDAANNP